MLVVSWFIGMMLCFFVYCILFCEYSNNQRFKFNIKILLFSIGIGFLYCIVSTYAYKYDIVWIRPLIMHIYAIFSFMIIYKQKIFKCLLIVLCMLIVSSIAEFLIGLIVMFVLNIDATNFVLTYDGYTITNISILSLTLFLGKLFIIKKFIINIVDWYDKNTYKVLVIFVIFSIIIFTFLLYNNFTNLLPNSFLLLTNLFCISVIFFVISYFREKANNNRIITEYDQLLDYVKKYEKVIEEKSKNQHEYKNQLTLIKGMIPKTNKKVINYIDELYSEQKDDNDIELLKKLQYLPTGGLKGLIYYKLEEMFDKKLKVYIDISSSIKNEKISKKLDKNLKDISKIIGVYMDNAIEAALKTKEKYIVLEVYIENNEFVFSLSNSYNNQISLNKIDNSGYSTKGEGHGYGLSLVKDIIDKNKEIRQERSINGVYYVQKLYIKK